MRRALRPTWGAAAVRHAEHINAAVQRLREGGVTGNQMPMSGLGGIPDDFTVKTQSQEALTKGLYMSVAAFILANMPKVDEVNLAEMNATLQRASTTMTALSPASRPFRWSSAASAS